MDGSLRVKQILEKSGHHIRLEKHALHANKIFYTDKGIYFLKNDTRPWFRPLNVSFGGPAVAVNAKEYDRYIKPENMQFVYFYGQEDSIYIAPNFVNEADFTHQNDGDPVYAYSLSKVKVFNGSEPEPSRSCPSSLEPFL